MSETINPPNSEGGGEPSKTLGRCCKRPRISILKRWTQFGLLHVIDRCRRCDTWRRRVIDISFKDGRIVPEMVTKVYGEIVKDAPPSS